MLLNVARKEDWKRYKTKFKYICLKKIYNEVERNQLLRCSCDVVLIYTGEEELSNCFQFTWNWMSPLKLQDENEIFRLSYEKGMISNLLSIS